MLSLVTIAGGMGTGKSRTLTEVPRLLKTFFPKYFKKHQLIVVSVSFENGTPVLPEDIDSHSAVVGSVAVRMMWQLKGQGGSKEKTFHEFTSTWRGTTIGTVAQKIHDAAGNNPLILLLVDGVHNVGSERDAYQNSNMRIILHTLSSVMLSDTYNLFPVASATVSEPVRKAMAASATVSGVLMHPPKLFRMPEGITQNAETVMSLTLGHPRAVEAVADVKKPHCSFKKLCEYAATNLSVRYRMIAPDVNVPHLLNMCFKNLSDEEALELDPVIASGLMTLNNWRLEIAPLWLALQRNLGSATLRDWDWSASVENQGYEKFAAQILAIRSHVRPKGATCLNDMHYGADWVGKGYMKCTNRPLTVIESSRRITSASEKKAAAIGAKNGNWSINTSSGSRELTTDVCVINGKGAPSADVFYRLSEDQTLSVSCKLQEHAGDVKRLSRDELRKNTSASVSPRDVHLVFTNKTLPKDWLGILRKCNPEATFGAVHSGNFKSYFGPFGPFWTAHTNLPTSTLLRHRAFMPRRLCRFL